jgi:glycosyltransferase involved in cell wall biosynthesis
VKQNDKTLVVLTPGFPANEADSTCLPAQQIFIKALNANFPSLKIIIIPFQYPFVSSVYQWHSNTVIPLNGRNKSKFSRLTVWLQSWGKLKKINKDNNIIGILSFWCTECALIGKYFGRKNNLIYYSWILGQDARKKNKFIKWINPRPENLIAMSDFLAEEFHTNYSIKPAHIISNGIDTSLFNFTRGERYIDILGAGSLIPLKQYDIFITIIKQLTEHIPDVRSAICGKGPEEKKLYKIINNLQLQDNITLTGQKDHSEVLRLMCSSKIFLHTSSYEGFSTVCLEALYAGAHVISFCNPVKEKIKNWHIVNNKEEMLQTALKILQDANTNYEPVLPYSMSNSAREMMKLFDISPDILF